jgi:hypothetical protein
MFYGKVKGRGYISQVSAGCNYVWNEVDGTSSKKYRYNLQFKRNINDVDGDCAFKTEEELDAHVERLKVKHGHDSKIKKLLDNYTVEEHSSVPIKKRFLISKLDHKFQELKISKAKGDCCGTCGWTISYDEPFLQLRGMQICIHCMKEFYDLCKPHLDTLDEAYHDTWLMERVTKEL